MAGRTGMRYEALYPLLDRIAADDEDWKLLLTDVQTLEAAALTTMNET